MKQFPVLISIPHGGDKTPSEIADQVVITPADLFADSDAFTRDIYGVGDAVAFLKEAEIARVFVDLNRETTDLPPKNPDGIVKTKSCHGAAVYRDDFKLDTTIVNVLIEKYYQPYHDDLERIARSNPDLKLMLDCHSMEKIGPAIGPDTGKQRPLICLGGQHGKSCPQVLIERMASSMRRAFGLAEHEVVIDQPFSGGYITRHYGNNPVPCIQIELNRRMYLEAPWFDRNRLTIQQARIDVLQQNFRQCLEFFFETI